MTAVLDASAMLAFLQREVGATTALVARGATAVPFGQDDATKAGSLWPVTRNAGLSLGDRACLTLALRTSDGFAVTTDRVWSTLDLDVRCEVVRGGNEARS